MPMNAQVVVTAFGHEANLSLQWISSPMCHSVSPFIRNVNEGHCVVRIPVVVLLGQGQRLNDVE